MSSVRGTSEAMYASTEMVLAPTTVPVRCCALGCARRGADAWHNRSARRNLILERLADFRRDCEQVAIGERDGRVQALLNHLSDGVGRLNWRMECVLGRRVRDEGVFAGAYRSSGRGHRS